MLVSAAGKVAIIWLSYISFILLVSLALTAGGLTGVKTVDLKEMLFAQWGYGWDGMHYIRIATSGYIFPLQAFFPLYPLVIKILDLFLPLTLAYRVNLLLLFPVLLLLYHFQSTIGVGKADSLKNLLLFLCFPTAFFLQANYTETLFILLTLLTFFSLDKKRYWLAALTGMLATLTKHSGILLAPIIFYVCITEQRANRWKHLVALACSLMPLLGLVLYFLYLQHVFGTYNVFFEAQAEWGRKYSTFSVDLLKGYYDPVVKAFLHHDESVPRRLSEIMAIILAGVLLIRYRPGQKTKPGKAGTDRIPLPSSVWLYCLLQTLLPVSTGSFLSCNRLILLAYPLLFAGFTTIRSKTAIACYVVVGLGLQVYFIHLFLNGVYVG